MNIIPIKNITKKLDEVSPSYCLAKWTQTTIYLNTGHTHSCHHPGVHPIPTEGLDTNPGQIHNTPYKQNIRQLMIDGHRPSECDYCWRIEDLNAGHASDRMQKSAAPWSAPYFDEVRESGVGVDYKPKYMEVLFESTCNFACVYCMPEVSSKWWGEINQHGPYVLSDGHKHNSIETNRSNKKIMLAKADDNPYIEAFWKIIPEWWPSLHTFRITGGEPLLSKHTWSMMDFVEKNANKELSFAVNTNLGVPDEKINQFIKRINEIRPQLKEFSVYTSVEAAGPQAEYIRHGMEYEKFLVNVSRILEETDAPITVMTTINGLCYSTFGKFVETFLALRAKYGKRVLLSFNYLRNPPAYDIQNLPDSIKEQFKETFEQFVKDPQIVQHEVMQLARIRDYMMAEPKDRERHNEDLKILLTETDRRRGLNSKELFTELWDNL